MNETILHSEQYSGLASARSMVRNEIIHLLLSEGETNKSSCIAGVIHEGEPQGTIETIKSYETYVTHPPASAPAHKDTAILLITDVLGHAFPNTRLIADRLATNGYSVYIPDLFYGDHVPYPSSPLRTADFSLQKWFAGEYATTAKGREGHHVAQIEPIVKTLVDYLRREKGYGRIGGVGYCFGAKYVVRHLGFAFAPGSEFGLDVGYVAHPSWVGEDELAALQAPLSIAAAVVDEIFTTEKRHISESILAKTPVPWEISVHSGVEHGFATKGDVKVVQQRYAKEKAFLQCVLWLNEFLLKHEEQSQEKL